MKRRQLLKGLLLIPFAISPIVAGRPKNKSMIKKIVKPKRLSVGSRVAVISPSSGVSEQTFEDALKNLGDLGFVTEVGKYARGGIGFLSGTDQERLHDLHWAFAERRFDAVWCVRGGYGASRLLPDLNYKLIKKNPKVFVGFSDITALHNAIFQKTGLITFHGPVGASNFTAYTKTHVLNALMNPVSRYEVRLPPVPVGEDPEMYRTRVITPGVCRGRLIGGNLSLLTAMAGTPYELKKIKGDILFLEDVNEQPYRIDRMFTQLRQSVKLHSLSGIALGVFTRSEPDQSAPSHSLIEVFQDRLGDLGIPVIYGLSFGHIRNQFTLPIGISAELNTATSTITFLESGVI